MTPPPPPPHITVYARSLFHVLLLLLARTDSVFVGGGAAIPAGLWIPEHRNSITEMNPFMISQIWVG